MMITFTKTAIIVQVLCCPVPATKQTRLPPSPKQPRGQTAEVLTADWFIYKVVKMMELEITF